MKPYLLALSALALTTFGTTASADRGGYDDSYDDRRVVSTIIRCESNDERTAYCGGRGDFVLVRQHSRSACIEGRSWGVDRRGLWVTAGCRADFAIRAPSSRRNRGRDRGLPDYGYDNRNDGYGSARRIVCESHDDRQRLCAVSGLRNAEIVRQLSRSECRFGYSWGFDRRGVWVDHGCRAEFSLR